MKSSQLDEIQRNIDNNFMWFDTHAHLSSQADPELILERAANHHIEGIVNICTTAQELKRAWSLKSQTIELLCAAAVTPHDVETKSEQFAFFAQAAADKKLTAIGETGLDYQLQSPAKKLQHQLFLQHITLALRYKLPLIVHCRAAFDDLFALLERHYWSKKGARPVIVHCFTGSQAEAKRLLEKEAYLSLSGIVTFNKAADLRAVAKATPLEQLLIETDSPYLAPVPKRGQVNEPSFLPFTGQAIAALFDLPVEQIAKITTSNARRALS